MNNLLFLVLRFIMLTICKSDTNLLHILCVLLCCFKLTIQLMLKLLIFKRYININVACQYSKINHKTDTKCIIKRHFKTDEVTFNSIRARSLIQNNDTFYI